MGPSTGFITKPTLIWLNMWIEGPQENAENVTVYTFSVRFNMLLK